MSDDARTPPPIEVVDRLAGEGSFEEVTRALEDVVAHLERVGVAPVVPVADHMHLTRIRRPDREVHAAARLQVRTQSFVQARVRALAKEVQVGGRKGGVGDGHGVALTAPGYRLQPRMRAAGFG